MLWEGLQTQVVGISIPKLREGLQTIPKLWEGLQTIPKLWEGLQTIPPKEMLWEGLQTIPKLWEGLQTIPPQVIGRAAGGHCMRCLTDSPAGVYKG
jgi:hypothetical protein